MSTKPTLRTYVLGGIAASTLIVSGQVAAQQEPEPAAPEAVREAPAIEQITVTARRREERLQDVPISVSTLTMDELESRTVVSIEDIGAAIPALEMDECGVANCFRMFIRGVGTLVIGSFTDPRVGLYIDGVYIPRAIGGLFDVLDVERVEVLRGPQGTLFGKNTAGGAIQVITTPPSGEFGGRVKLGIGTDRLYTTQALLDFPILEERLYGRLSWSSRNSDGYMKNVATGSDAFSDRTQVARLSLRYLPTDNVDARFVFERARVREDGQLRSCDFDPDPGAGLLGLLALPSEPSLDAPNNLDTFIAECDRSWALGPDRGTSNLPARHDLDTWLTSGTLRWDLGWATVKSITAWRRSESFDRIDFTGADFQYFDSLIEFNHDTLNQELQLSGTALDDRVDWVGGAFLFREKEKSLLGFSILTEPTGFLPIPLPDGSFSFFQLLPLPSSNARSKIDFRSWALYGEATYHLTERLALTAGVRRIQEAKYVTDSFGDIGVRFKAWTPRANLSFRLNDSLMVYGGWSRGYTSGGFNIGAPSISPTADEEKLDSWEVGFKSDWFDNRLRLNVAAYYSDFENIQVLVQRQDAAGNFSQQLVNAAEAEITGFEVEMSARPLDNLMLSFGWAVTDADYKEFNDLTPPPLGSPLGTPPTVVNRKDLEFSHVPDHSFNVTGVYEIPAGELGMLSLQADYEYRSRVHGDILNSQGAKRKDRGLLNARVALQLADGRTEIALWGRNILDREYYLESSGLTASFGTNSIVWARDHSFGLELSRTFGN